MKYITSIRVGQNDIKALIKLEENRRDLILPLLNMRGNSHRHLDAFIEQWRSHPYFLDISRYPFDAADTLIVENDLLSADEAYVRLRDFYREIAQESPLMIPVASWHCTDPTRETIQFVLALERRHPTIALRADLTGHNAEPQSIRLRNILDALDKPQTAWVILDCGVITQANDLAASAALTSLIEFLRPLKLGGISIISTSFPDNKPANGTARSVTSIDLMAQNRVNTGRFATALTYGDYAATNPAASIDYVHGMHVIPFASYLSDGEWWQCRRGGNKQYAAYVDIASDIVKLPGFHGAEYCWATSEISRIAEGTGGTGNNGTWNGLRINQHVCAMLDQLMAADFPAAISTDPDEDNEEL